MVISWLERPGGGKLSSTKTSAALQYRQATKYKVYWAIRVAQLRFE